MSRRQSVPSNWFYRKADPLPPLFPEPHEGDHYFNTTRNVLRVFSLIEGSNPEAFSWQDFHATADHTHPSTVDYNWTYDSVATMGDPGAGKLRTNTNAGIPATQIAFDNLTDMGIDASRTLSLLTTGDMFLFQQRDNAANYGEYRVTAAPTNNNGWFLVPVEGVGDHGGTIAKNQVVLIRFVYGIGGGGSGGLGGGGTVRTISVISTSTALSAIGGDYVYVCSATLTATLPTAVDNKNLYTIKRTGTGNVTVATTSSQTIDGATTFVLDTQYMSIDLISTGTNWVVI